MTKRVNVSFNNQQLIMNLKNILLFNLKIKIYLIYIYIYIQDKLVLIKLIHTNET
jgi:hypothetical protein